MLNFLVCGIIFWVYAYSIFKKDKIFYPSVIFSFMWGAACLYTSAILGGYGDNLYLKEYYVFKHMNVYIVYFTIVVMAAFLLAHLWGRRQMSINMVMDMGFIERILSKYHWIMWVNFFGGLLRMAVMINLVGFDSVMDYRVAANSMMMTSSTSVAGIIFKLTAYVQMLSNFYVALYGLRTGFGKLNLKQTIAMFILYSPTQMATGGRLFILYFILYFFGAFLLGRGLSMKYGRKKLLEKNEKRVLIIVFSALFALIGLIAMLRSGGVGKDKENLIDKFAYITEGILATEYIMDYFPVGTYPLDLGQNSLTGSFTDQYLSFRRYLQQTKMSAIVICFFTRAYIDFGYWGTLVYIFLFAFLGELISLNCLKQITLIKFCVFIVILKMFYESVIASSVSDNIPSIELIILFLIFYKVLFGRFQPYSHLLKQK